MIRVRSASEADLASLASLMVEFYAEADFPLSPQRAEEAFRALLTQPALGGVWMLEADGQPAGFVVLTVCYSMEYGGLRGAVDDLFVRPGARRRGLADAALAAVREAAVARGLRALHVEVGPENAAAQRLYARHGFGDSGRQLLICPLTAPLHET